MKTLTPSTPVRWALASLSLSMLMPSLDTSIANAGLPTLAQAFDAAFQDVQWIVLAYLLAITTLIVSVGRLGDLIGRKRLLLGGILIFTLASLGCGLAPSLGVLVAARAVQGLGAAIMLALTVAFVADTVPKAQTGSAMGLLGTMSAAGTTLGPSLGGVLISGFGWQTIFLVNVPLGVLNFVLAYRCLPADRPVARRSAFDFPGTLLLALTLGAYALAMTLGEGWVLLIAGVGGGVFLWVEARSTSPLIKLALFRERGLGASLAMSALVSTVMMSTLVVGPFYLSGTLGLNAALVGLTLSVGPLVAALGGMPAGRLVDRFGAQRMTVVALATMALGAGVLTIMPAGFGVPGYVVPIAVITASYALFQAANNTSIMTGVSADQRGVIAGLLSLSRNLGLITGASAMGAVFVGNGMRVTFAVAAGLIVLAVVIALRTQKPELTAIPCRS
ncbi:MFS family permease [Pseudomonas sp. 3296]|uniref:MFS transporter n=1 Tax=Pseudomonas sp. 3296 TaxID=2817753 RepID=UPI002860072C|nr:MFS transporter [Pseudomonas sp. 3296]MDR6917030.1 MFS family permease [Pseudomonas sp. 3296]